jgi:hypothetical protein
MKKNNIFFNLRLRRLWGNDDAGIIISRLIAIGIPMIILIILQSANAFGIDVWAPLLSISFIFALLITGVIIMVLGLKLGFYYPVLIIFLIWVIAVYTYVQFEANLI